MNEQGIRDFLREIGARNVKKEGDWVMSSCPLAPWKHESGRDSTPSMGISIHENDKSIGHCFTCKFKGTLPDLLAELEEFTGEDWSDLREQFGVAEEFGAPMGAWERRRQKRGGESVLNEPLSEDYIDLYDSAEGHPYAQQRRINRATCRLLQLRIDPEDSKGAERLLFPVRGPDGRLYGFTGRATERGVDPKVRDYHGLKKRLLLFGAHLITEDTPRIAVTEGPVDCAKLWMAGVPAVATLHSELTLPQEMMLKSFAKPLINFMDRDRAGRLGAKHLAEKMIKHVPVLATRWPDTKRVRDLSGEPKIPTDVGMLYTAEIRRMAETARLYQLVSEGRGRR